MILRHTCFLATLCSIVAWTPPQTAQQPRPCRLRAAQLDADAYPPAPWSFSNARVLYQPTLVRTSAARAVTPRDGLTLLSFLGWTRWWRVCRGLDGVTSRAIPRGRRAERAGRAGLEHWRVGLAHRRDDACQRWWRASGLRPPDRAGKHVEFKAAEESDGDAWRRQLAGREILLEDIAVAFKVGIGAAQPGIAEPAERLRRRVERAPTTRGFDFSSDADVAVTGWDGWSDARARGRTEPEPAELLGPARGISRVVALSSKARSRQPRRAPPVDADSMERVGDDLAAVLDGPRACPCIQVDGEAGRPEVVWSDGARATKRDKLSVSTRAPRHLRARTTSPRAARSPKLAPSRAWAAAAAAPARRSASGPSSQT